MNINEMVANAALERLGLPRGRYDVIHPIDHVNRSQSTNDVYPTAIRIAVAHGIGALRSELGRLASAFNERAATFTAAAHLFEASWDTSAFLQASSLLRRCAVKLSKISNDLRLLSSGPQAGLGEIRLPPRQAGSSIMPGKVNPVIPETINQIAFAVMGADVTVGIAGEAGQDMRPPPEQRNRR